ncbi:MAG: hypothetical protein R2941_01455 [Desulfobacterales bacterium]
MISTSSELTITQGNHQNQFGFDGFNFVFSEKKTDNRYLTEKGNPVDPFSDCSRISPPMTMVCPCFTVSVVVTVLSRKEGYFLSPSLFGSFSLTPV